MHTTDISTIDVSIVIVNYNTSKLINDCIDSIFEFTVDIDYEIIIVDNATENLSEVIKQANHSKIKLVQLEKNLGFGLANNEGFKIAKGRNFFCLNPDTILLNNAIKILSDYLDSNSKCGACGGNLLDENMMPTLSFRRFLPGIRWEINDLFHLWPEKIIYKRNSNFNYSDSPIKVGYITGADLMIKSTIYNRLNGFSPDFFMYYEETDLCAQINSLGYEIMSVPQAKIQHLEGRSFDLSKINNTRIDRSEKGRLTYMRRNHSVLNQLISNTIHRIFLFSRWKLKSSESHRYRLHVLSKLLKKKSEFA